MSLSQFMTNLSEHSNCGMGEGGHPGAPFTWQDVQPLLRARVARTSGERLCKLWSFTQARLSLQAFPLLWVTWEGVCRGPWHLLLLCEMSYQ